MKHRQLFIIVLLVGLALLPVWASTFGWFGDVAKAIGDTTWRIVLIKAMERMGPMLLLGVLVIGAIGSYWAPMYTVLEWIKAAREAIRTGDKLDRREAIVLTVGAIMLIYIGWHLLEFGSLLADSARAGLGELNREVSP